MPPAALLTRYDRKGVIRKPSGSTLTGIVPTNTYLCADGKYVVIGGNGDSIYKRLMVTANRAAIATWTASLPSKEVRARVAS